MYIRAITEGGVVGEAVALFQCRKLCVKCPLLVRCLMRSFASEHTPCRLRVYVCHYNKGKMLTSRKAGAKQSAIHIQAASVPLMCLVSSTMSTIGAMNDTWLHACCYDKGPSLSCQLQHHWMASPTPVIHHLFLGRWFKWSTPVGIQHSIIDYGGYQMRCDRSKKCNVLEKEFCSR